MKASSVRPPRHGGSIPSALKCVIIYEDFASGARARHFAEMLGEQLGGTCDCESLWRIELLEVPEFGDEATRQAAASEFVIIALRGDRRLSLAFRRWIEGWLSPTLGGGFSLIALFDSNRSTSHMTSARCALREMSAAAGVAFFAHCPSGSVVPPTTASRNRTAAGGRIAPRPRVRRSQSFRAIPSPN